MVTSDRMDVAATDKEIRVTAELPGIDEKKIKRGVEVSLGDDILTIEADKNPG